MILIPDSSFFVCFYDDLGYSSNQLYEECLQGILTAFTTHVVPAVCVEVDFMNRHEDVKFLCVCVGEIIFNPVVEPFRMLLGKGEFEVITYANNCLDDGILDFKFILDDLKARKIVENFVPALKNNMIGTIGTVKYLALNGLLDNEKCIFVLKNIDASNFRISSKIINGIIIELGGDRND